jgi:glycosyltransferase involved in cell wall biosynthesis
LTKVIDKLSDFRPNIIYAHYPNNSFALAYFVSVFFDRKLGIVCHATYDYPEYINKIINKPEFILVKSKSVKNFLLQKYPGLYPKKITVLPWGIDTEFFRRSVLSTSEESGHTSSEVSSGLFTILSVSRFVEMKGLIYLLQACKLLAGENIKFKCILVGYGPLKSYYERLIKRNKLKNYIKILPPIPHTMRLKKLLSFADVFVLPAIINEKTEEQDFIPNAVLEAMAMEKVVITTKVTGMQEVAKDGESIFFVKEKDPVDLAKKVGFYKAYIAMYSDRPMTAAHKVFKDDISHAEKKRRWKILEDLINKPNL